MSRYFEWFGLRGSLVLTVLMSVFALVLAVVFPQQARWICFAAMVLSSAGDVFLMDFQCINRLLPVPAFYAGAVAFMLAHLVYAAAFLVEIRAGGYRFMNPGFYAALAFILAVGAALFGTALKKGRINPSMLVLCIVYAVIISVNCTTICSYAWSVRSWRSIAALGALSFFVSDLIIGVNKLLMPVSDFWNDAIWWFYPIGQILILLGG